MVKNLHEIRDAIHVFVRVASEERKVLDSRPFQRLRHINQLALSPFVYPGATHKRFEHSLGVMELAGRVFDVVTRDENIRDKIREALPELSDEDGKRYWRRVLRISALCHDIGHLPFSHAAEDILLPEGWSHEYLTRDLILSDEMENIWNSMTPPLRSTDIVKLAVGPTKLSNDADYQFTNWQAILAEIIVGDAFGVDRMDYLLRDSHHVGVTYGRFDHHRLIDTLRILPSSPTDSGEGKGQPELGIEHGGLQSAEALAFARYFMYSQVYFHPVRRSYDLLLGDFMKSWLPDDYYPTDTEGHLSYTDNEVWAAILKSARNSGDKCFEYSDRILNRKHFRVIYQRNPEDIKINMNAAHAIFEAAKEKFGEKNIRMDSYTQKSTGIDFPVLMNDERIASSISLSDTLNKIPVAKFEFVYCVPEIKKSAQSWCRDNGSEIIKKAVEEDI
jgi:HD superfamily phosphohydrolase